MGAPFSPAFLRGEARALAFLPDDFRDAARRAAHVHRAGARQVSAPTLAALRAQAAAFGSSPARQAHLDALGAPGTTVVVTGQQVGLFLGPLYAFYKAASAVAVARALRAETGRPCVPVFWLQSEDHDFEEIHHCDVPGPDGAVQRLTLEAPPGDARRSVASLALGDGVGAVLEALEAQLHGAPHAAEVMALLRAHYQPGHGWVRAFAGVLSALFADEGLVLLDPRDPALAEAVRGVHLSALEASEALSERLHVQVAALEAAGFSAQVHVRPGAPLSFFHPDGAEGPRFRLAPEGDAWALVGREGTVSSAQLQAAPPLCWSSSALLRPLVQDTLLPTAAIVAGPGELNYFAQVEPLYEAFGLPMPMLVPRARFRVVEARPRALLKALGLTAQEVEAPREAVLHRLRPASSGLAPEALAKGLEAAVAPLLDAVPVTPELADAVARTRGTIARAASRLAGRYARALQQNDETLGQRVDKLQRALFPLGAPQERVLSWPTFASRLGVAEFKARVFAQLDAFGVEVQELEA